MTPPPCRIETARPADRAEIIPMALAAFAEYASQIPAHWDLYRADIIATLSQPEPAEQWVARLAGEVVGTVLLYPPEPGPGGHRWPEVRLLAVHPDRRGAGIAAALMLACIQHARQLGADAVTLHTSHLMQAATRLYLRLGFQRAPDLDYDPAPGLTILGYCLVLTPAAAEPRLPLPPQSAVN